MRALVVALFATLIATPAFAQGVSIRLGNGVERERPMVYERPRHRERVIVVPRERPYHQYEQRRRHRGPVIQIR